LSNRLQHFARLMVVWLAVYALMVGISVLLPVPGGDWYNHWLPRQNLYDYPPWVAVLLFFLPSLPFLSGLTLTAMFLAMWKRQARWIHIMAAFTAMPLYWTLWLGQVDAVPMLGLMFLPWGIPLVLLKPQVAVWYTWTWWRKRPDKWRIVLGVLVFIGSTFLVWGWWPASKAVPATITSVYNLSLWKLWWPLGLAAAIGALLESDPDRAMALGAMASPYIQGSSYLVLLPALARLNGWTLVLVWATTWSSVLVLALGDAARPLAALFPLTLWTALAWQEYRHSHTMPSGRV
jgi:hypothetical protein